MRCARRIDMIEGRSSVDGSIVGGPSNARDDRSAWLVRCHRTGSLSRQRRAIGLPLAHLQAPLAEIARLGRDEVPIGGRVVRHPIARRAVRLIEGHVAAQQDVRHLGGVGYQMYKIYKMQCRVRDVSHLGGAGPGTTHPTRGRDSRAKMPHHLPAQLSRSAARARPSGRRAGQKRHSGREVRQAGTRGVHAPSQATTCRRRRCRASAA